MGFQEAFKKILVVEGEIYTNRAADRGGPTKFGITQKTLEAWRNRPCTPKDVEFMLIGEAEEIYESMFWNHNLLDQVKNETIADILFDQYVNRSPAGVTRQIQRALIGQGFKVEADGIIGVQTINAINQADPVKFGVAFVKESQDFYVKICQKDPSQLANLGGWINRTQAILDDILNH